MSNKGLKGTIHGAMRGMEEGKLYLGTVESVDPVGRVFSVMTDMGVRVSNCQWGAGIFSGLIGVKCHYLPPPNTRVTLLYTLKLPLVMGAFSGGVKFAAGNRSRTHTGQADKTDVSKRETFNIKGTTKPPADDTPGDMLEGEYDLMNMTGVGIAILTNLAKLQAGDRAKVEVCLLNDMVRIVSQTFKHYSALGNFEIYNDGRLNARWEGTSYDHEAWGKETAVEKKAGVSEIGVDLGSVDQLTDTLRSRFSQYVGFLGDFIHTFVTDPAVALGDAATARSGKFSFHVNADGGLLVQSVADIAFERVCRIVVPIERKRWDDPTGNAAKDFDTLDTGPLRPWTYNTSPDTVFHTAYQLRHYARWLSGVHSLARFHQLKKDWVVPNETDVPAPKRASGEADKSTVDAPPLPTACVDTYACFRIMRDGSTVTLNGWGGASTLIGPDGQFSVPRNLLLEAGNDVVIVAGHDIIHKARRNVEISAITGGLVLKARTWLRLWCEWGSIIFRSDADPLHIPTRVSPQDPNPDVLGAGVVIQSKKSGVAIEASTKVDISSSDDITLRSTGGDVTLDSYYDAVVRSRHGFVKVWAAASFIVACMKVFMQPRAGIVALNKNVVVRGPNLEATGSLISLDVRARAHYGMDIPGPSPGGGAHGNHIIKMPDGDGRFTPHALGGRDADNGGGGGGATSASDFDALTPPAYPSKDATGNKPPEMSGDYDKTLFETLTQQRLRNERGAGGATASTYGDWDWSQDGLKGDMASPRGYPWPGKSPQDLIFNGGEALDKPSSTPYSSITPTPNALVKTAKSFRFLKH